ncbi:MAG: hypothetical protein AABW80_04290 [Nanoarchaeota archaeon]
MDNALIKLFEKLNNVKITYCVRGRYKHLPSTLDSGDVDLLIKKSDFDKAKRIIEDLGFLFYSFAKPNLFYYFYDSSLGLIQLDILLLDTMPELKKFNNFYIPLDGKTIPNRKTFFEKVLTFTKRKLYYFLNGKLIVFEGPDGSGKSTNADALFNSLSKFPLKVERIHFATHFKDKKPSTLKRAVTRLSSLLKVCLNVFLGRITITDRYIYLTFRKSNSILKNILRSIAPKPDIVFLMKVSTEKIKERKKGQRDELSEKMIKELYNVYENIKNVKLVKINTEKPIKENVFTTANLFLKACLK